MNTRVDLFLDKYKQLENAVKNEYRLGDRDSAVNFLMNKRSFQNIKNELDLCRETRNLLSHNPKVNGQYAVEPSEKMIQLLDKLINKITNPLRANDIMIKKSELCYRSMHDSVREAMLDMHKKSFAHVPILEDDRLVGVFSENTLLSILIDEEIVNIDDNLKFDKISKYLELDRVGGEEYYFVAQDTSIMELSEMYKKASDKNDRIGMIFVSQNGKPTEKILGIITAWEVAAELDEV